MKIFKQCWSGVTQDTEQHGHVIAYKGEVWIGGGRGGTSSYLPHLLFWNSFAHSYASLFSSCAALIDAVRTLDLVLCNQAL